MKFSFVFNKEGDFGGIGLYQKQILVASTAITQRSNHKAIFIRMNTFVGIKSIILKNFFNFLKILIGLFRSEVMILGHINFIRPLVLVPRLMLSNKVIYVFCYGIDIWGKPKWLSESFLKECNVNLVFGSHYSAGRCEKAWYNRVGKRTAVIQNALDEELFTVRERKILGLTGKKLVTTIGRQDSRERYKGTDCLIEAFAKLRSEESTNLELVVIGDGSDLPRLQRLAAELNVMPFVHFTKAISHAEKKWVLMNSEVLVLCGAGEGFGYVIIEALAMGCEVIGSESDGSSEACGHGKWGRVILPFDKEKLCDAIRSSTGEDSVNLAEHFPVEEFRQERFNRRLAQLLGVVEC